MRRAAVPGTESWEEAEALLCWGVLLSGTQWPDLASKTTGSPVKLEFQINSPYCLVFWGHTYSKTVRVVYLVDVRNIQTRREFL